MPLPFNTARYYDPAIGRFISADTVVPGGGPLTTWPSDSLAAGAWGAGGGGPANPQALNRYSYALNNPVRYTDRTGHFAWILAAAGIGAAINVGVTLMAAAATGELQSMVKDDPGWRPYTHERNFGCRATEYVYRGLRTVALENELIRVTILADKGSDIVEFLHKPTDTDFMWRAPQGVRNPATFVPTAPRPEGAFLDYYPGGWQECLPTGGGAARYAGTSFGPHGELCLIPWDYALLEDEPERVTLCLRVRGYRTPLFLEKRLTLVSGRPVLFIAERLVNEGREPFDLMWGHHPAFGPPFIDPSCVIDLPGARVWATDVQSNHRYTPGADYRWPLVQGRAGEALDISKIPAPETGTHDTVFLTELAGGWYGITNTARRVGFGMAWPSELFGALWFWQVYGGAFGSPWYGRTYNIALEPWTTPHTTIEEAMAHGTSRRLAPGEAVEAELCAVAYAGLRRITGILPDGEVSGEVSAE